MYVDEPPKDDNIPDFNISKIDICPFRVCQRSFRLFQSDSSKDIHQRSRLLCFTQHDHTGQTGFKICPFLKWDQLIYISLIDPTRRVGQFRKVVVNIAAILEKKASRRSRSLRISGYFESPSMPNTKLA